MLLISIHIPQGQSQHFVGDRKWVHLDIAGTARSESDSGENPKGGTGFGVRLLVDWILSLS